MNELTIQSSKFNYLIIIALNVVTIPIAYSFFFGTYADPQPSEELRNGLGITFLLLGLVSGWYFIRNMIGKIKVNETSIVLNRLFKRIEFSFDDIIKLNLIYTGRTFTNSTLANSLERKNIGQFTVRIETSDNDTYKFTNIPLSTISEFADLIRLNSGRKYTYHQIKEKPYKKFIWIF